MSFNCVFNLFQSQIYSKIQISTPYIYICILPQAQACFACAYYYVASRHKHLECPTQSCLSRRRAGGEVIFPMQVFFPLQTFNILHHVPPPLLRRGGQTASGCLSQLVRLRGEVLYIYMYTQPTHQPVTFFLFFEENTSLKHIKSINNQIPIFISAFFPTISYKVNSIDNNIMGIDNNMTANANEVNPDANKLNPNANKLNPIANKVLNLVN